jgi:hypothetical protein
LAAGVIVWIRGEAVLSKIDQALRASETSLKTVQIVAPWWSTAGNTAGIRLITVQHQEVITAGAIESSLQTVQIVATWWPAASIIARAYCSSI